MEETYAGNGIRFRYPTAWELVEQEDEESASITVASPETSFWSISLFRGAPSPQQLIASAIEAFREEYDEVDVYPSNENIGDRYARRIVANGIWPVRRPRSHTMPVGVRRKTRGAPNAEAR